MTRTYRIPRSTVVGVGAFSAVWIGLSILGSLQEPPVSLVFLLLGLIPLGYLFVFTQVTLADDGSCEFRGVARRRRIRAQRITAISTDEEAIYVHHDRGKIHMWETDNFDDLLSRLLELNPADRVERMGSAGARRDGSPVAGKEMCSKRERLGNPFPHDDDPAHDGHDPNGEVSVARTG